MKTQKARNTAAGMVRDALEQLTKWERVQDLRHFDNTKEEATRLLDFAQNALDYFEQHYSFPQADASVKSNERSELSSTANNNRKGTQTMNKQKKQKTWIVTVEQTVSCSFHVSADTLQEARDAVREDLASDWDAQSVIDWSTELNEAEVTSTDVRESYLGDVVEDYITDEKPDFTVKDGRLVVA